MKEDRIITLEDNQNFLVLDETVLEEKKYLFTVKLLDNQKPTEEFSFFEEEKEENDTYVYLVEDEKILDKLNFLFSCNYYQGTISEE